MRANNPGSSQLGRVRRECGCTGRRGFTLIELMIAVVIVGLLAAIAIPKYTTASWKTMEKEAEMFLKQVYVAHHSYMIYRGQSATSATELNEVGFVVPARMEYYAPPAEDAYALPLCLVSTGAWPSRQIDDTGAFSDC